MNNFSDGKIYPEDPVFLPSVLVDVASAMTLGGDASETASSQFRGVVGKKPKTAAIILAGGSGERFGHEGGSWWKLQVVLFFRGPSRHLTPWRISA